MAKKVKNIEKKNVVTNIFSTGLDLGRKSLKHEISETKKGIHAVLMDYESTLDSEYSKVIKSTEQRVRNTANAAKGKYKTALEVVTNCYPYQTENGLLLQSGKDENKVKVWKLKKLSAVTARGIIDLSLKNFVNTLGNPTIQYFAVGEKIK